MQVLLSVDDDGWREAVPQIREHYAAFGDRLPQQLAASLDSLEAALA
jgi:phosphoenolpyruvate carboxykinase (GTP)